jgi:hypothetical protein
MNRFAEFGQKILPTPHSCQAKIGAQLHFGKFSFGMIELHLIGCSRRIPFLV